MISLQVELYLWQNAFRILFVNSFQLYCSHIMLNYVQIYLIDRKNVQKGSGRTQHNVQWVSGFFLMDYVFGCEVNHLLSFIAYVKN